VSVAPATPPPQPLDLKTSIPTGQLACYGQARTGLAPLSANWGDMARRLDALRAAPLVGRCLTSEGRCFIRAARLSAALEGEDATALCHGGSVSVPRK
jgi:hypothetical protein